MGQPVVLPKFELPGDRPHWAIRAAWITGGLLILSVVGLAVVIVQHRNLETQAHIARAEAIARVKAEAEAKVAAIAAAARAKKEAEIAARIAAQTPPAAPPSADGNGNDGTASSKTLAKTNHGHHGRPMHTSKSSKVALKPGGGSKTEGKSASNKPDPIDELLKKMK